MPDNVMSLSEALQELGFTANPSEDDLKARFRKLAKENHPDIRGDEFRAKFQRITAANEVIKQAQAFDKSAATFTPEPKASTDIKVGSVYYSKEEFMVLHSEQVGKGRDFFYQSPLASADPTKSVHASVAYYDRADGKLYGATGPLTDLEFAAFRRRHQLYGAKFDGLEKAITEREAEIARRAQSAQQPEARPPAEPAPQARGQVRPLAWKPDAYFPHATETVWVDVNKLDVAWAKTPEMYVSEDGKGTTSKPERYRAFGSWIKGSNAPIEMPVVGLNGNSDGIAFQNGRHRFAWLRDHGVKSIPVAVSPAAKDFIQSQFGTNHVTTEVDYSAKANSAAQPQARPQATEGTYVTPNDSSTAIHKGYDPTKTQQDAQLRVSRFEKDIPRSQYGEFLEAAILDANNAVVKNQQGRGNAGNSTLNLTMMSGDGTFVASRNVGDSPTKLYLSNGKQTVVIDLATSHSIEGRLYKALGSEGLAVGNQSQQQVDIKQQLEAFARQHGTNPPVRSFVVTASDGIEPLTPEEMKSHVERAANERNTGREPKLAQEITDHAANKARATSGYMDNVSVAAVEGASHEGGKVVPKAGTRPTLVAVADGVSISAGGRDGAVGSKLGIEAAEGSVRANLEQHGSPVPKSAPPVEEPAKKAAAAAAPAEPPVAETPAAKAAAPTERGPMARGPAPKAPTSFDMRPGAPDTTRVVMTGSPQHLESQRAMDRATRESWSLRGTWNAIKNTVSGAFSPSAASAAPAAAQPVPAQPTPAQPAPAAAQPAPAQPTPAAAQPTPAQPNAGQPPVTGDAKAPELQVPQEDVKAPSKTNGTLRGAAVGGLTQGAFVYGTASDIAVDIKNEKYGAAANKAGVFTAGLAGGVGAGAAVGAGIGTVPILGNVVGGVAGGVIGGRAGGQLGYMAGDAAVNGVGQVADAASDFIDSKTGGAASWLGSTWLGRGAKFVASGAGEVVRYGAGTVGAVAGTAGGAIAGATPGGSSAVAGFVGGAIATDVANFVAGNEAESATKKLFLDPVGFSGDLAKGVAHSGHAFAYDTGITQVAPHGRENAPKVTGKPIDATIAAAPAPVVQAPATEKQPGRDQIRDHIHDRMAASAAQRKAAAGEPTVAGAQTKPPEVASTDPGKVPAAPVAPAPAAPAPVAPAQRAAPATPEQRPAVEQPAPVAPAQTAAPKAARPAYQSFVDARPDSTDEQDKRFGQGHAQALGLANHNLTVEEKKQVQADMLKIVGKEELAQELQKRGMNQDAVAAAVENFADGKMGNVTKVAAEMVSQKSVEVASADDKAAHIAGAKVLANARAQAQRQAAPAVG